MPALPTVHQAARESGSWPANALLAGRVDDGPPRSQPRMSPTVVSEEAAMGSLMATAHTAAAETFDADGGAAELVAVPELLGVADAPTFARPSRVNVRLNSGIVTTIESPFTLAVATPPRPLGGGPKPSSSMA